MKKFASFFAVFLFITLFAVASEAGDRNIPVEVAQLTDSLKKQFAPDRRVALLDVDYSFSDKNVMLRGGRSEKRIVEGTGKKRLCRDGLS